MKAKTKAKNQKLLKMVEGNIPDEEIMSKLGIKTKVSLRRKYFDALVEAGRIKSIVSKKVPKKKVAPKEKVLTIGNRRILILGKAVIDKYGYKEGDRFQVSKRSDTIVLKKVE